MHTVQILVDEEGNREVITGFLDDTYEIVTASDVREADAYLVEDAVYPEYRDALQQMVQAEKPVFRPVVLIQRADSRASVPREEVGTEGESPVADIIETPIREPVVRARLASLLRRREQSMELQQTVDQVERQRDGLSMLNQMVRHDIRNDMQLVLLYARQLSDSVGEEDEETVETIISSANDAIELTTEARELTDLLLEEGSEVGSIGIDEVVTEELEATREAHPNVPIEYHQPDADVSVVGDQMLSSVVRNLVTNAIRHNDAETPRVSVSVTETGASVVLSVADNGPGIPDEDKGDIFDRGAMGTESPGTGIGLYLVSAIVDRYGGTVRVGDSPLDGAEFIVELETAE